MVARCRLARDGNLLSSAIALASGLFLALQTCQNTWHRCLGAASVFSHVARAPLAVTGEELKTRLYHSGGLWKTNMHVLLKCGAGEARFRLAYMPMRNRAEIPRLILEEAQCPYELEIIGFENWYEFKTDFPHGKVPVLYNYDGQGNMLAEEVAITQFLARQLGLAGETEEKAAHANMLYQLFWCTIRNNGVTHDGDFYSAPALAKAVQELGFSGRTGSTYQEVHRVNNHTVVERSLAALGVFEDQLEATGTGFLVEDSPTYVDLALFVNLFDLAELDRVPDFATRFNFPRLGEFLKSMESRPQLNAYLKSPGRIPRYSRPTGRPGSQTRMSSGYDYCTGKYSPIPQTEV